MTNLPIAPWAHLPTSNYEDFTRSHSKFLLYGSYGDILTKVSADGYAIRVAGEFVTGDRILGNERQKLVLYVAER